jgi:4-amino-4-deoxy-L-arabinose transferase-like glycosyltransferase
MAFALTARERRWLAVLLVIVAGARLATLPAYPLMDPTEARYAEIARKMLETGDWVMPQFDYGVPFWGKPPLSEWLSAAAMAVFGSNEFAARLPSFLLVVGCGALVHRLAAARGGRDQALWTLVPFATTALVFVAAGAVMTDPALALGTTLSMAGFWLAVSGPEAARREAAAMFFFGLAVGLLAKGPVAAVLTLLPVGAWTLWTRRWAAVWRALPWVTGAVATAIVVVPWYWAAEHASPGFLDYFLVGEHWKRFVEPGWKGDLYGAAHARPHGMIWLFWIGSGLPWSLLALGWVARTAFARRDDARRLVADPWLAYLALWAVTPMLFFTVSGNVLATYVLPGLPAFALLLGELWRPAAGNPSMLRPAVRVVVAGALLLPVVMVAAAVTQHRRFDDELSHEELVELYHARRGNSAERLVYVGQRPPSAEFYARGKALKVPDAAALAPYLADANADFFVFRAKDLDALPAATRARLAPLGEFGDYRLLRELPP